MIAGRDDLAGTCRANRAAVLDEQLEMARALGANLIGLAARARPQDPHEHGGGDERGGSEPPHATSRALPRRTRAEQDRGRDRRGRRLGERALLALDRRELRATANASRDVIARRARDGRRELVRDQLIDPEARQTSLVFVLFHHAMAFRSCIQTRPRRSRFPT